ncbi:MAG: transcription elongation factor [Pseudomonadales bacterium]|nr:transcription elongation factor [Pseudomonadales bacterium]RLU03949.1 MAG: transcription elongation factor [Ketobacter sp.]
MPTTIHKHQLHAVILTALKELVDNAQAAVDRAYEAATHEENIAENKYDTLGLEASYLTQGQARRLAECKADLAAFEALQPKTLSGNDKVSVGALVTLLDENECEHRFFLGPAAGGVKVRFNDCDIVIITTAAPLGKALLNSVAGDEVVVKITDKQTCYEILNVR